MNPNSDFAAEKQLHDLFVPPVCYGNWSDVIGNQMDANRNAVFTATPSCARSEK